MSSRTDDLAWMREQVTARNLSSVWDTCLEVYLDHFKDRELAVAAIDSVWHGRKFVRP